MALATTPTVLASWMLLKKPPSPKNAVAVSVPATFSVVKVPTVVILGCELAVTVTAVLAVCVCTPVKNDPLPIKFCAEILAPDVILPLAITRPEALRLTTFKLPVGLIIGVPLDQLMAGTLTLPVVVSEPVMDVLPTVKLPSEVKIGCALLNQNAPLV